MGGGSSKSNTATPQNAPSTPPPTPTPKTAPPPPPQHYEPTYTIDFEPSTPFPGFGIEFMSPLDTDVRVYVKRLIPDGLAAQHHLELAFGDIKGQKQHTIVAGDMLVAINAVDVSTLTLSEINEMLRSTSNDTAMTTARTLGFYAKDDYETYQVHMNRAPSAGAFGARIINTRFGENLVAVVLQHVRMEGQALKAGARAGDSIMKIGTENIHSGARAQQILRYSTKDTLLVEMCHGLKMGQRETGQREPLSTDTDSNTGPAGDQDLDLLLTEDFDQNLTKELNAFDKNEQLLRSRSARGKKRMSNRIQERLEGRELLKNSVGLLKNTILFKGLSKEIISSVIDAMKFKTFQSGQSLMTQGQFGASMVIVLKGTAHVLHDKNFVKECQVLETLGEGSLIEGDHVRGATVVATSKVHVLTLIRDQFNNLIDTGILNQTIKDQIKQISDEYDELDKQREKELMTGRIKYTVEFNTKKSLGLQLMCLSKKDSRVFVRNIVKGSQSEKMKKIVPGHQLLKIGEVDITSMELKDVTTLLIQKDSDHPKQATKRVTFAADDVAEVGLAAAKAKEDGAKAATNQDWISFMSGDGEDESTMTFAEINAKNADIVLKIQQEQQEYEKQQQEKRIQQQEKMNQRVQQRLQARARIKSQSKCLSNIPMFQAFEKKELAAMIDAMDFRTIAIDQNVVTQGDDASEMMIITNEKAHCSVTINGKEVRTFAMYDIIGEATLLAGDHHRGATVTASGSEVQVLCLTRCKWESLFTSGVIREEVSTGFQESARKSSAKFDKVDNARVAEMVKNGEVLDEGVSIVA
jgi:CRP-like cAMP-binding protein